MTVDGGRRRRVPVPPGGPCCRSASRAESGGLANSADSPEDQFEPGWRTHSAERKVAPSRSGPRSRPGVRGDSPAWRVRNPSAARADVTQVARRCDGELAPGSVSRGTGSGLRAPGSGLRARVSGLRAPGSGLRAPGSDGLSGIAPRSVHPVFHVKRRPESSAVPRRRCRLDAGHADDASDAFGATSASGVGERPQLDLPSWIRSRHANRLRGSRHLLLVWGSDSSQALSRPARQRGAPAESARSVPRFNHRARSHGSSSAGCPCAAGQLTPMRAVLRSTAPRPGSSILSEAQPRDRVSRETTPGHGRSPKPCRRQRSPTMVPSPPGPTQSGRGLWTPRLPDSIVDG